MTDKSAYTRAPHIVETPNLEAALGELARLAEERDRLQNEIHMQKALYEQLEDQANQVARLLEKRQQQEIENVALRSQLYNIEQLSDFEGNESRAEMIRALDTIFEIVIVGRARFSQPADSEMQS